MLKNYPLLFLTLFLFYGESVSAQCASQSTVEVIINPDGWPKEIHWSLRDGSSGVLLDTGDATGDVICVPTGQCLRFNLFDDFGDGLLSPGNVQLVLDSALQTTISGNYGNATSFTFNCPPGTNCSSAILVDTGTYTAPLPDTWYRFIADTTGNYTISTCALGNTCDTRIYIYSSCTGLQFDDAGLGVSHYNDNLCGTQSELVIGLAANQEVIIRIGDSATDCSATTIDWAISFTGPIIGCTDPNSCTYNPLAEISDTSMCIYTGPQCQAPDLAVDKNYLESSMFMDNFHNAGNCEVDEGCVMGYGVRKLLKYGVQIWNYGQQPYYVGDQISNPNAFEYAPCHGHFHYKGFAESYLFNSNFQQVDFARKTSYAIINMQCLPGYSAGGPALAPGCSDIYGAGYSCQWVDVTNLDTGFYYLVLKVNSGHFPDYLGRSEYIYHNNSTLVCFDLTEDQNGNKNFTLNNSCAPYVDCVGDTFGTHLMDCAGDCNGVKIKGDLSVDTALSTQDVHLYLDGMVTGTLASVSCTELTGDNKITVYDAARLNACIRNNDSSHIHIGGSGNHAHCNFPFGIENPFDTVTIGLTNPDSNFVDVNVLNPRSFLLGFEFTISGIKIDSVKNIAGNFSPQVYTDFNQHIVVLAEDEFSINKQTQPLSVLRVYFSQRTDSVVCIDEVVDVVNSNYERVSGKAGNCVLYHEEEPNPVSIQSSFSKLKLQVVPNPGAGMFEITGSGALLFGANVKVHNSVGGIVYSGEVTEGNNRFLIDLKNSDKGVYVLTVSKNGYSVNSRLVVLK